ncbi:MAG: hypothetical protein AAF433_15090 [Bacteroidota bacterium]
MKFNVYRNLESALRGLSQRGYRKRFYFGEGLLRSTTTPRTYLPTDLQIVEYHRFRQSDAMGSFHTVYALITNLRESGLFVHAYQANDPLNIIQFLDRVPIFQASPSPLIQAGSMAAH